MRSFRPDGRRRPIRDRRGRQSAISEPEIEFFVVDQYQGEGVGAALMHHLATIAFEAGLKELIAEVLPDNAAMLIVFEKSGFPFRMQREPRVVHVAIRLC